VTDEVPHTLESSNEATTNKTSAESNRGTIVFRIAITLLVIAVIIGVAVALVTKNPAGPTERGRDDKVTSLGSAEVTGKLIEIRGKFLPNDGLYNYAFVLKYHILEVHRGNVEAKEIVVAHYNPLKPRSSVADEFYPDIGGTLKRFRAQDIHRMALDVPIDDYYIGGIVDRYFDERKGEIYWAVWTNLANEP